MNHNIALFLYSALWWPVALVALLRLLLKSVRQPSYRQRIKERFGVWPSMPSGCFWVHAVSVGEVIACKELVEQWMIKHPNKPVLITTMTPTGSDTVKKLFAGRVFHAYLPWDLHYIQRRLVQQLKPSSLTIMETELWPNLIHACHAQQVPVIVANARLSERSYRGYRRFSALTIPMLQCVSGIAAQHAPDGERFAKLGVQSKRLQVTGSIKFDIAPNEELQANIKHWRQSFNGRPTWVAASTHPGEEALLLDVHKKIIQQMPNALLLLVPRHIERANKISELISQNNFKYSRRSVDKKCAEQDDVFLVDTLGELMLFYGAADVAFIGNSLNNGGGHNPIEPASLAVPIISGNSYVNFQTIFDAMKHEQAAIIVESPEQLTQRLIGLFKSKDLKDTFGQKAFQFYQQQQGALGRLITWIEAITRGDKNNAVKPTETH